MIKLNITLPEGFLEEEERCGYTIPKSMKECWAVQMDLLAELDRVCKNNGIQYFAHAGTLLGAVRHQGFIPWDDDIDLVMLREDYEKLAALPASEFGKGYFLQSTYNDAVMRGHLQLRRDGTTLITENNYGAKFHRGIFIDIFVFDALPESEEEMLRWKKKLSLVYKIISFPVVMTWRRIMGEPLHMMLPYMVLKIILTANLRLLGGKKRAFNRFEALCRKYENTGTDFTGDPAFLCVKKQIFRDKKSNYSKVLNLPFENTTIPCPAGYDDALRAQFGDYQEYVVGTTYHGDMFADVDVDFSHYDKLSKKEFRKLFEVNNG